MGALCFWGFMGMWRSVLMFCALGPGAAMGQELSSPVELASLFAQSVDRCLVVPAETQQGYAQQASGVLAAAGLVDLPAQVVVVVDSNPLVQALMLFWMAPGAAAQLIGASPVSTGRPGQFDHFATPLGVFAHAVANLDFRAQGTKNENGIKGYGEKGLRVFDFGWQLSPKGWGDRRPSTMRLQMHATDPSFLEPRLGSVQSKGCVRIPATLNKFIDHYGLLDADYEQAMRQGARFWVLDPQRQPTPWSGRYLVVLDSGSTQRPPWSAPGNGAFHADSATACR